MNGTRADFVAGASLATGRRVASISAPGTDWEPDLSRFFIMHP